jgi:HSP20 family molecular chaperone IbpA
LKIENKTIKIGSVSNAHNLTTPNGFRELYGDDGKLHKLTADFRGFAPENVKIVLSANNVLKVSASQSEQSPTQKGGSVQKECTRHYTLPAWVQPENMKAIMSRDGILTVDFNSSPTTTPNSKAATASSDDRINIKQN